MKKILCALLAVMLLTAAAFAEETLYEFDDFSLTLPELSDAQYADKADGAYLFYGVMALENMPVVAECRWMQIAEMPSADALLDNLNASAKQQGLTVNASAVTRDEEIALGGRPARLFVIEQQVSMLLGFRMLEMNSYTAYVVVAEEGIGTYVFTVSASDQPSLDAGLETLFDLTWKE